MYFYVMVLRMTFAAVLTALLVLRPAMAGEEIPGAPQRTPIAFVNGTVHTVKGGTLERATVVAVDGRITAVGTDVVPPAGARVIDCTGKHVYPGFITPSTTLGLTELDAVRATRDMAEVGTVNPNARAETAYNPDSELLPTVRSNGILLAGVMPVGGTVSGTASLMRLDGWTREDIAVLPRAGLVIQWPAMDVSTSPWERRSPDEQQKAITDNVRELYTLFREAQAYATLVGEGDTSVRDIRLEAMRAAVRTSMPVFVHASTRRQIEAALDFRRTFDLRMVLVGADAAPMVLDDLKSAGVPIIIDRVHSLPERDEDPYDAPYTLPATLAAAGIPFAFSDDGAWQQRNLPFHAGTAMAFGLAEADAERALTLWPAMMYGVDSTYGALAVGYSATLFVCRGNALDALTNVVDQAFIDGREVDLSNRHRRLARKYRERYRQ